MSTIAYNTTRQTIVETVRSPSGRTQRRHALKARQAQAPAKAPARQQAPMQLAREDSPMLLATMPSDKPEYWEFQEENNLILIVARMTPRAADTLRLVFEAFPKHP